jgi:hypothetical protein
MATYNPYFPVGYQPYNFPYAAQNSPSDAAQSIPQGMAAPQRQTQQSPILWVQGEAGAKAFPVAPNQTVQLWDSEAQVIYLKSADTSGMPTMKVLDYTIREQNSPISPVMKSSPDYITREEFEKRLAELKEKRAEE